MFTKYIVPALCATNLLGVEASHRHRNLHKKDVVYVATEIDTVTDYVTVTVYEEEDTATSVRSFYAAGHATRSTEKSAAVATSSSTTSSVVVVATPVEQPKVTPPTTLATTVKTTPLPVTTEVPAVPAAVYTTPILQVATTTKAAATTVAASSGVKRGLAYNDPLLVSTILGLAGSKFSWAYNWGADSGGISGVSYIPMLWGPTHFISSDWTAKAEAAVTAKNEALLSFNECDNAGQCNLSPADTSTYHQQYMNPYEGKIRIGAPAISSSANAGQGLDWLSQFFSSCAGRCAYDFCNIHWYGPGDEAGAKEFLGYLINAQATCGKNIWVTEFAAVSGDSNAFIKYAIDQLDNNSTFAFVEKYSYFMLSAGSLFDTTTALSSLGELYIS